MQEVGTLAHRAKCVATTPDGGWPSVPKGADRIIGRLSSQRLELLNTRALLVLRLPSPPKNEGGHFEWIVDPTHDCRASDATWYFDGSMLHGEWKSFRATGFGLVVTHCGTLLGYGRGTPPHWCTTAAAAEAWALATVLGLSPTTPAMRTDCLSLLRAAESGMHEATAAKRKLARVWTSIFYFLDGTAHELTDQGKLVWMPAHLNAAAIGEKKLSDGSRLSAIDWRSNRLADALAKSAACRRALPEDIEKLLNSAAVAVRHAATSLGRVTHAANNHAVTTVGEDGSSCTKHMRDATQVQRQYTKRPAEVVKTPTKPPKALTAKAWTEPARPSAKRKRAATERAVSRERLLRRVQAIGDGCTVSGLRRPAAERQQALVERIRSKASAWL